MTGFFKSCIGLIIWNVRLAASRSIDKEGVVQSIFTGIETKADNIFDPTMPYNDVELVSCEYDIDQAKSMFNGQLADIDISAIQLK